MAKVIIDNRKPFVKNPSTFYRMQVCPHCHRKRKVFFIENTGSTLKYVYSKWGCTVGHTWTVTRLTMQGYNDVLKEIYIAPMKELFNRQSVFWEVLR